MTAKGIGAGNLFPAKAKSRFLKITSSRYDNMLARVRRKGFFGLPFGKDGFRQFVLSEFGNIYDGFVRCHYCGRFCDIEQVGIDHAIPLSRGGGVELDNLEFPCAACNDQKGGMTPEEYILLLDFLENKIPLAKSGVLNRLQIATKLAAADSYRRKRGQRGPSVDQAVRA